MIRSIMIHVGIILFVSILISAVFDKNFFIAFLIAIPIEFVCCLLYIKYVDEKAKVRCPHCGSKHTGNIGKVSLDGDEWYYHCNDCSGAIFKSRKNPIKQ